MHSFAMEIMNFRRFFVVYCTVYRREVMLMPNRIDRQEVTQKAE